MVGEILHCAQNDKGRAQNDKGRAQNDGVWRTGVMSFIFGMI